MYIDMYSEFVSAVDKVETLKGYKFSLAFENSNEEDYVTEKFFQSLVAGMRKALLMLISVLPIFFLQRRLHLILISLDMQCACDRNCSYRGWCPKH